MQRTWQEGSSAIVLANSGSTDQQCNMPIQFQIPTRCTNHAHFWSFLNWMIYNMILGMGLLSEKVKRRVMIMMMLKKKKDVHALYLRSDRRGQGYP